MHYFEVSENFDHVFACEADISVKPGGVSPRVVRGSGSQPVTTGPESLFSRVFRPLMRPRTLEDQRPGAHAPGCMLTPASQAKTKSTLLLIGNP